MEAMKLPYGLRMLYTKMLTNKTRERRIEQLLDKITIYNDGVPYTFYIRPEGLHCSVIPGIENFVGPEVRI